MINYHEYDIIDSYQHDLNLSRHELDISSDQLKKLQSADVTLRGIREVVKNQEADKGVGFFTREGLVDTFWSQW